MAKITHFKGKQTGLVITTKVVDGDPVEFSKTKTSEIKDMSTADKIKYSTDVKEQNRKK